MPNIASAAKRMRSDAKKNERNQAALSELKSMSKKLFTMTDAAQTEKFALEVISKYDRAVTRGIIPHARADRKKSRVAKFLAKLKVSQKKK